MGGDPRPISRPLADRRYSPDCPVGQASLRRHRCDAVPRRGPTGRRGSSEDRQSWRPEPLRFPRRSTNASFPHRRDGPHEANRVRSPGMRDFEPNQAGRDEMDERRGTADIQSSGGPTGALCVFYRCSSGVSGHAVLASTPHPSGDEGHHPCVRSRWLADASGTDPIGSRSRSIHKRGGACSLPTSEQLILLQRSACPRNHATPRMAGPRPKLHSQRDIPGVRLPSPIGGSPWSRCSPWGFRHSTGDWRSGFALVLSGRRPAGGSSWESWPTSPRCRRYWLRSPQVSKSGNKVRRRGSTPFAATLWAR